MTTLTDDSKAISKTKKENDPFWLGWRTVKRRGPDRKLCFERIPLTMEDIHHPQEEDFRVHTLEHKRMCVHLNNIFELQTRHDPRAVVLHDTRVKWDVPGLKAHGPDVALIFGVRERKNWGTFSVAQEGTRPTLIVEITSPETRHLDLEKKPSEYEKAGVEYYVIVDINATQNGYIYQLIGRHLTPEGYVFMTANQKGWLWLPPLRIWIGICNDELNCYDEQENRFARYAEISQAYLQLQREIQQAKAQTELERKICRELEEELRRLQRPKFITSDF